MISGPVRDPPSPPLFFFPSSMGVPNDDVVLIQKGKQPGEPHVITVNCPDKTGLGCDICRIILDFGLYITKGGNFSFDVIVVAAVSFAFLFMF